jgi:hypothetical protein
MSKKQQPRTTNDAVKQFIKLLESGGHSRSIRDKFADFLELAYCAVAKTTAPTEERADELEERYMKTVKKYRDEELEMVRETYPHMLAIVVMALQWGDIDFLGHVAGELSTLDSGLGQFFTPYEVSKMMARMTFVDAAVEVVKRDGYITLCEPAAGAGGMVLAYADVLQEAGLDPAIHMLVQVTDVSYVAYQMCFLQLAWRGVAAQVIRGNSLSLQTFESAWTPAAVYRFLPTHGHLSFDKAEARDQQQVWQLLSAVRQLFEPSTPTAISPVGERWTISEMTFRYAAKVLPVILPLPTLEELAEEVVEVLFANLEEPITLEVEHYVQIRMF